MTIGDFASTSGSNNRQESVVEHFNVLGISVRVIHPSDRVADILTVGLGAMRAERRPARSQLTYRFDVVPRRMRVTRRRRIVGESADPGPAFRLFEKDLVVELQRQRSDLLFLHAAALECRDRAFFFAADSGQGKSMATWALLHHGFRYLSDELAPIDLETMTVHPYPHALCLKQRPPDEYPLPASALDLGTTIHIPVEALPCPPIASPRPLGGAFLLRYDQDATEPSLRRLSPAEAAARLYVTTLNALAHTDAGLAPVLRIANSIPCYSLVTSRLGPTVDLVRSVVAAT